MRDVRRVIVGVDLDWKIGEPTEGSQKALAQGWWLADRTGARLQLVTSTYADPFGETLGRTQDEPTKIAERALTRYRDGYGQQGLECEDLVTSEKAWLAITRMVQEGDGHDVVVVAKRTGELSKGRKLGAVATKLLRSCPSPVWVVKAEHDLVHRLVMAATDLTAIGDEATRAAAYVAEAYGCELHVVHAYRVPPELVLTELSEEQFASEHEKLREAAQARMERALEGIELTKPATFHVVRSTPTVAIRESVEHLDPDLLVMGTISKGGPGLHVGDTAERLLDVLNCSLLTLKPADFVTPI